MPTKKIKSQKKKVTISPIGKEKSWRFKLIMLSFVAVVFFAFGFYFLGDLVDIKTLYPNVFGLKESLIEEKALPEIPSKIEPSLSSSTKILPVLSDLQKEIKAELDKTAKQNISIESDDQVLGSPKAPITIMEFTDYECPYCQKYAKEVFPLIRKDFIAKGLVKYVVKDLPLPSHSRAFYAALASRCLENSEKYFDMHDLLFEKSKEWLSEANVSDSFEKYAKELGLNDVELTKFKKCYEENGKKADIEKDIDLAVKLGVDGTPAFFVNGYYLSGYYPYEIFSQILEVVLAEIN